MNRIDYLLQRYIEDRMTPGEREELFRLLKTGQYDKAVETKWRETLKAGWKTGEPEDESVTAALESLLDRLPLESAESTQPVRPAPADRKSRWAWMAAAAAVTAVTVAGLWLLDLTPSDPVQREAVSEQATFTDKQFVSLPDGSTVLLNDGSELRYKESFGQQAREVFLAGEAFFDVTHDPSRPFIVHTGKLKTTVLGTAFNVKAYEHEIVVTVTRGRVAVADDEKEYGRLAADEQLAVNTHTYEFEKIAVNAEKTVDWKNEFLVLEQVTMEEAARMIGERFGVTVKIANPGLKKCTVRGAFLNEEGVQHVVAVICLAMKATYTTGPGIITIEGGVACP